MIRGRSIFSSLGRQFFREPTLIGRADSGHFHYDRDIDRHLAPIRGTSKFLGNVNEIINFDSED